jgi:hypothetical protein
MNDSGDADLAMLRCITEELENEGLQDFEKADGLGVRKCGRRHGQASSLMPGAA